MDSHRRRRSACLGLAFSARQRPAARCLTAPGSAGQGRLGSSRLGKLALRDPAGCSRRRTAATGSTSPDLASQARRFGECFGASWLPEASQAFLGGSDQGPSRRIRGMAAPGFAGVHSARPVVEVSASHSIAGAAKAGSTSPGSIGVSALRTAFSAQASLIASFIGSTRHGVTFQTQEDL